MQRNKLNKKSIHFEEQFSESEGNDSVANQQARQNAGEPIQLIKIKPNGQIEVSEEALDIIAACEKPVGFVSLVGKSRTGKSFLLNRLLHLSGAGFRVDPSTHSCTEGIWMWSSPYYNDYSKNDIFFLDTEGTDSTDNTTDNDAKIFTLAVLISSYFMYNSVGNIDERSLSEIQMITTLSKHIKSDQILSERDNQDNLHLYMPKFLWILRDFTLKPEDQKGRRITATQYLENCLIDQNSMGKSLENTKKVKKSITNYFRNRECLTMVRPCGDEEDLQRLNTLPDQALRREFIEGVNTLREKIMKNTGPKRYENNEINGSAIATMIESYVNAFNEGKVPSIKSAWQQISIDEGARAFQCALNKYDQLLDELLSNGEPKDQKQMNQICSRLKDETIEQFNNNITQKHDELLKRLKQAIKDNQQENIKLNNSLNQCKNYQILKQSSHRIQAKFEGKKYAKNINDLKSDMEELRVDYNSKAKGYRKGDILAEFMTTITNQALSLEKENDDQEKQRLIQIQERERQAHRNLEDQKRQTERKRREAQSANNQLKKKNQEKVTKKEKKDVKQQKSTECCAGGKCEIM